MEPTLFNEDLKFTSDQPLRALSWKQPFADLMLCGKIETRTWDTKVRGWVLICASRQPYNRKLLKELSGDLIIGTKYEAQRRLMGCAIGIGYLSDSRPMKLEDESLCFVKYNPNLFCHIYTNVKAIIPIPWKGGQGWRKVGDDIKTKISVHQ